MDGEDAWNKFFINILLKSQFTYFLCKPALQLVL